MREVSPRTAARTAYLAAALNLAAPAAMLLLLREGLPVPDSTPAERMAYLTAHVARWRLGWLVWHAAALSLLAFYAVLALRWWSGAPVRCTVALLCAAAGLAADLSAQGISMALLPRLTADQFAPAEDAVTILTGYAANGLYTTAGILLTWAGMAELPRGLVLLSLPVWAAGLWLSAAALWHSSAGLVLSNAALFPLLVIWIGLVGRWLSDHAS